MTDPDNPFAALSGLSNLPKGPKNVPQAKEEDLGADAGAMKVRNASRVRLHLDRKHRRGKTATLVKGLENESDDYLEKLTKEIKSACGVGGSTKDGEIIIQGDKRKQVKELLEGKGFRDVKFSG